MAKAILILLSMLSSSAFAARSDLMELVCESYMEKFTATYTGVYPASTGVLDRIELKLVVEGRTERASMAVSHFRHVAGQAIDLAAHGIDGYQYGVRLETRQRTHRQPMQGWASWMAGSRAFHDFPVICYVRPAGR